MNTINTANCILHPSRLSEIRPPTASSLFTSHFIPPLPKPTPQAAQGTASPPLSALPAATMTVPEELPTSQASVQDFEMFEELSREMELPTSPSYAAIFELSPPPPPSYQEDMPPGYEESHEHDTIPVAVVSEEEQDESEEEEEDDR
jgi:hypothetical protein